jgi:hypothetical protein
VEGSAPITEEAIATPPIGDTKASAFFLIFWSIGRDVYIAPGCFLGVNLGCVSWQVMTTSACCCFLFIFRDFFKRV